MRANPFFWLLIIAVILPLSCNNNSTPSENLVINLRWIKSYPAENKSNVEAGLVWSLSFLGATLPRETEKSSLQWIDDSRIRVDFSGVGFSDAALQSLRKIISAIKTNEEYQKNNGVDIGRFIMLTLCSSNHYYAITGAEKTYMNFKSQFKFADTLGAIVESGVAKGNRQIEISDSHEINQQAFVAREGRGSLHDKTFNAEEFEVFDFMPNGQLRFAIYDKQGNLKPSGSPELTDAGKPAKCLWCHEINIQPLFFNKTDVPGHYSTNRFQTILSERVKDVDVYRAKLKSIIDFTKRQDHTQAELLYLCFMEPSVERLAMEWNLNVEAVKERLKDLPTHPHEEFPFLCNRLYHRKDIDAFAPYKSIRVPDSARDLSEYEPNLLE